MNVAEFKRLPFMGIVRGIQSEHISDITECVVSAGLKTVEITMNTADASNLIHQMIAVANGRITVGAGTVLSLNELHLALDAGASFIVSPTLIPDVADYCANNSIPFFPGALTPHEILNAWNAGATMVKVFPAGTFGPSYFKEIKGPFGDIELLACGGVNASNIKDYLNGGASGVAFGSSLFKNDWIAAGEFSRIEYGIKELIENGGMS